MTHLTLVELVQSAHEISKYVCSPLLVFVIAELWLRLPFVDEILETLGSQIICYNILPYFKITVLLVLLFSIFTLAKRKRRLESFWPRDDDNHCLLHLNFVASRQTYMHEKEKVSASLLHYTRNFLEFY